MTKTSLGPNVFVWPSIALDCLCFASVLPPFSGILTAPAVSSRSADLGELSLMETRETFPKARHSLRAPCTADVEAGTVEERKETANTRTSCGVYFKLNAQGHAEVESILEGSSADDHNAACRRQGRMAARIQPGHLLLAIDDQPCVALCSVGVCLSCTLYTRAVFFMCSRVEC